MYRKIVEASKDLDGIVNKTPVLTSRTLNNLTDSQCFIKCENFQRMGAFKFRGAYNALRQLSEKQKKIGVVTHSSGNHAQAIALSGSILGIKTVIVMPESAPKVKIDATKGYGAEIVFCEPNEKSRRESVNRLIEQNGYTLVHPYDNENVIAGQGTTALELINETGLLDYLFVQVGGGGLMSGCSIVAKESEKISKVIGAEPKNADDAYLSFKSGEIVPQLNPNTIADGLRTSLAPITFNFIRKYVDDFVTVSEEEIVDAMRFYWERMKIIVEPSGAVSLASFLQYSKNFPEKVKNKKIGIIISGGNIDLTEFFNTFKKQIEEED
ncbi:MAG: pyridoxal-phosphate dependent enzyme [Candidatus Hodarchaeales archaeon]|jgi:threonine dehydratase